MKCLTCDGEEMMLKQVYGFSLALLLGAGIAQEKAPKPSLVSEDYDQGNSDNQASSLNTDVTPSLPPTPHTSPSTSQELFLPGHASSSTGLSRRSSAASSSSQESQRLLIRGLSLSDSTQNQTVERDMREVRAILGLDGGGARGYITMLLLNFLEEYVRNVLKETDDKFKDVRLIECFDFVSGTSAGAIAVSVLTKADPTNHKRPQYDTATMLEFFEKGQAAKMFHRNWLKKITSGLGLFDEKYSNENLREALASYLGDAKLKDACVPTMITTYELLNKLPGSAPRLFTSYADSDDAYYDVGAVEAAMASGAAPTYFERMAILSNILSNPDITLDKTQKKRLLKSMMKGMYTEGPEHEKKIVKEAVKRDDAAFEEVESEQDSEDEGRCPPMMLASGHKKSKKSEKYQEGYFIDGGMGGVNAPVLAAVAQVSVLHPSLRKRNMEVISVGTGVAPMLYDGKKAAHWGLVEWLPAVIEIALNAPTQTTHNIMEWVFRKGGYTRWSPVLLKKITLDDASAESLQNMKEITTQFFHDHKEEFEQEARFLAARYLAKQDSDHQDNIAS
jgi:hypothetical protein